MSKRMLRCAILAVGDFPEGGATSQRLYLLARLLNEGGFDASLWILHPVSKIPVAENSAVSGEWSGIKFRYLSGSTVRPTGAVEVLLDTFKGIYECLRLIAGRKHTRPDFVVVYTPNFMKFIVPLLVAKFLRIPLIIELCEILSKTSDPASGVLRRLANSGESLMERLTPVLSAGLLVISQGIRRHYESLGINNDAIHLLPVLIDKERYDNGGLVPLNVLNGERYFLNSGSFCEKDGLNFLVEAMVELRKEFPDIKLVFTGNAGVSARNMILDRAGPGGVDWIIFAGLLSRDQLIWCYKKARGLLCCRSNSDYANLGFPTKLAEYLATGRPVVATKVGDIENYISDGDSAYLAIPENVASIAGAMRALMLDPARADLVGMRGAVVAKKNFDYRNHVEAVSLFIRRRIEEMS